MSKDKQILNAAKLPFPQDPSGRAGPLRAAIVGLANVQNADIEKVLADTLKVAVDWLPARCAANRKELADKRENRAAVALKLAKEKAEKDIVAAEAELERQKKSLVAQNRKVKGLRKLADS